LHPKFFNKSLAPDQKCLHNCSPTFYAGMV
jgi:hypothetical protein